MFPAGRSAAAPAGEKSYGWARGGHEGSRLEVLPIPREIACSRQKALYRTQTDDPFLTMARTAVVARCGKVSGTACSSGLSGLADEGMACLGDRKISLAGQKQDTRVGPLKPLECSRVRRTQLLTAKPVWS